MVVDCSVPWGDPTPLRMVDLWDPVPVPVPVPLAPTVGAAVEHFIRVLDDGTVSYDGERGVFRGIGDFD